MSKLAPHTKLFKDLPHARRRRGRSLGFRGLGFRGLVFRVAGLGFRGLVFRGLGFRGLGFTGLCMALMRPMQHGMAFSWGLVLRGF